MPPPMRVLMAYALLMLAHCLVSPLIAVAAELKGAATLHGGRDSLAPILVVGSINVDITMQVDRLPDRHETLMARSPRTSVAVGGKGANQAVAAARLAAGTGRPVHFIGQLGNDEHAAWLEHTLTNEGVGVSGCGRGSGMPSGQGFVMLDPEGGASSVVVAGANTAWPNASSDMGLASAVARAAVVLLQREVPEEVNMAVAAAAAAAGVPVLQDAGGEARPLSREQLQACTYLAPNEQELALLTGLPANSQESVLAAARSLQATGARNVLVTRGAAGAVLLLEQDDAGSNSSNSSDGSGGGSGRSSSGKEVVLEQAAIDPPGGAPVADATGAGDAFRAAFAVAMVEGRSLAECLRFGAAAAGIAVSRLGAVPSLPHRAEVYALLGWPLPTEALPAGEAGPSCASGVFQSGSAGFVHGDEEIAKGDLPPVGAEPLTVPRAASRLNSMRARWDLWQGVGSNDVLGWIERLGTVAGLDLVSLNYPEHLKEFSAEEVREAVARAALVVDAVNVRFPPHMSQGGFTHPDAAVREEAIRLTVEACYAGMELGATHVVVWPAFDGYNYNLEVDHTLQWQLMVQALQQVVDACPGMLLSLEFKPTHETTRFTVVPSTGAALLLARDVDRHSFGLTLDVGHLIMAGENPAQSIALVAMAGKLFGLHLNDGHAKLGAEDGLAFGAVHSAAALEAVLWLQRTGYSGTVYFDTFPLNEDPVREAAHNVRRLGLLWQKAHQLRTAGADALLRAHDAMGVLELLEAAEKTGANAAGRGSAGQGQGSCRV